MKKREAFTLIELVSVLVILAILALIVTPLVLNIIRKARTSADKRSIDAYGRSIELAIADYLLDNGTFPTSIDELTIEYSGDRVVCSTTQLNSDSSVYLAGCTVNGRVVTGYTYGKEEIITYDVYEIGDEVTYNNIDYYVIKNSSATEANVTLLKVTPLTYEEVLEYSSGTDESILNKNGYGGISYHSSNSDYSTSIIKQVVDNWALDKLIAYDLYSDETGYSVRLITYDDLTDNLGYEKRNQGTIQPSSNGSTPNWIYDNDYNYWTMSPYQDSSSNVWRISSNGSLSYYYSVGGGRNLNNNNFVVRPVITIKKSALN